MKRFIFLTAITLASVQFSNAQLRVIPNGNVSIGGATTPTARLQMNGLAATFINSSTLQLGVFAADPRVQAVSKVVFFKYDNSGHIPIEVQNVITVSDERLKTNINPLGSGAVDIIKQLKPVTFRWSAGDDKKQHAGFLAQDIEKVLPNLVVNTNDSTGTKGVSYTELIPYLVQAINEQQQIIEGLQAKLNASAAVDRRDGLYAKLDGPSAIEESKSQMPHTAEQRISVFAVKEQSGDGNKE